MISDNGDVQLDLAVTRSKGLATVTGTHHLSVFPSHSSTYSFCWFFFHIDSPFMIPRRLPAAPKDISTSTKTLKKKKKSIFKCPYKTPRLSFIKPSWNHDIHHYIHQWN